MIVVKREYIVSANELAYLRQLASKEHNFPEGLLQLEEVDVDRSPVLLSVQEAEHLRDYLFDRLSKVGFDDAYVLNTEGRILESLIDKLFVP